MADFSIRAATYFDPDFTCKFGHNSPRYVRGDDCVECARMRATKWATENREKRRQISAKYRVANATLCSVRSGNWQTRNREYVREKAREKYARNPQKDNVRVWRRLAKIRNAPGRGVTDTEWTGIVASHYGRCAYCARLAKLEMDHIEPLARGGAHDPENITAVCRSCNSSKGDNSLLVWLASGFFSRRNANDIQGKQ